MVRSCCAVGCSNRATKGSNISFHKIPSNPERRKLWLEVMKRLDPKTKTTWKPSIYDCLCSEHFTPDDFYLSRHAHHKLLKDSAIPSIFLWTKNKKPGSRKTQMEKDCVEQKEENGSATNIHVKFIDSEHTYSLGRSPSELKRKLEEKSSDLEAMRLELANSKRREKYARTTAEILIKEMRDLKKSLNKE